jgi:hypothetical protein
VWPSPLKPASPVPAQVQMVPGVSEQRDFCVVLSGPVLLEQAESSRASINKGIWLFC